MSLAANPFSQTISIFIQNTSVTTEVQHNSTIIGKIPTLFLFQVRKMYDGYTYTTSSPVPFIYN